MATNGTPLRQRPLATWQDLDQQFDHMFRSFFPHQAAQPRSGWTLPVEVQESPEAYTIRAEVPGVPAEQVSLTYIDETLKIEGEKQAPQPAEGEQLRQHVNERTYGRFTRQLRFPVAVDPNGITAEVKDGLLTVRLPKAPEAQPRQIQIQVK